MDPVQSQPMNRVDCNCIEGATQVFNCIVPLHGGRFEDKVLLLYSLTYLLLRDIYIYIYIYIIIIP